MEARVGGQGYQLYGTGASDVNGLGKKSVEWDLNDWKWDGDLFLATPLNASTSDCRNKQLSPILTSGALSNSSSSCSEEAGSGIIGKGKAVLEKRRRVVAVEYDEHVDEGGSLTLNLGSNSYQVMEADLANWDDKNGKKSKLQGANSIRPLCQVEGCGADLSDAKDYHRRHKVCEMHAKASSAVVGNVVQRFCQQCSRFHLLQEFDEAKRSCRRRLAGHNRRRRKTHPGASVSGNSVTDEITCSYLLISLLRILANLHADNSSKSKDQDILSYLLKNLANLAGTFDFQNLSGLLRATQDMHNAGNVVAMSSEAANPSHSNGVTFQELSRPLCGPSQVNCTAQASTLQPDDQSVFATATIAVPTNRNVLEVSLGETAPAVGSQRSAAVLPMEDVLPAKTTQFALCSSQCVLPVGSTAEQVRLKDFDLNDTYKETENYMNRCEQSAITKTLETGSANCPSLMLLDSHRSSPPQTSGNSDSTSAQSLSNSNGDAQSRTGRIVFKLFGKDPRDLPIVLRAQILNWLSHVPTDMESYIRPGCVILTIYLQMAESVWEKLFHDLSSSLNRLLDNSDDGFWRTGWVYARVEHQIAFIYNGQIVLDTPLLLKSPNCFDNFCVSPIAVPISAKVNFKVKGFDNAQSAVRILCAFEGKYLEQDVSHTMAEENNNVRECRGSQLFFSCSLPNSSGRGFIEVEDQCLCSIFLPFIVAEKEVCSEICMLEKSIDVDSCDVGIMKQVDAMNARNQAIEFLHEMGWLLHGSQFRLRSEKTDSCLNAFSLARFRWLFSFSMDWEWCAVVKKLLDLLVLGNVYLGSSSPCDFLSSSDLLHSAVQKNRKSVVELMLRYKPTTADNDNHLFRPDMLGPSNITPLHIAAASSGAEGVLDALTDDPGRFGIKAWRTACDSSGFTPEDYARARGYQSYIQLVQKKIDRKPDKGHVVLNIPAVSDSTWRQSAGLSSSKLTFEIDAEKMKQGTRPYCKRCDWQVTCHSSARSVLYRPAMLSMVGIAAVCVCVGLLLKTPPFVVYLSHPFRWELLAYGSS